MALVRQRQPHDTLRSADTVNTEACGGHTKATVGRVARAVASRTVAACCVLRAWTVSTAGWDGQAAPQCHKPTTRQLAWWPRQAGALRPLSTAAGARVGRDENLTLVALGAFVHGRHALCRLVEVDDEPPARWLCEAHRDGGVCRGGGEAVEGDAPPDEHLVRRLLLLAKVAQATVQPFWARAAAPAAAPPLVEERLGQQLRSADGAR